MKNVVRKRVVITGASSGIGASTARLLAESRARVVLAARRTERLEALVAEIEEAGGQAFAVTADVTSSEDMQRLAAQCVESYGGLDVWINNAGIMPLAPLEMNHIEDWDQMIDVNIKGVLYGIAAAQPHMRAQGAGHVINVSSIAGHRVFSSGAVYCATKFAVRAISEGLRMESGGAIRVTNISPGFVKTELSEDIRVEGIREYVEGMMETIAIAPEAIARAIAFAINEPEDVDVNEMMIRPTRQDT